MNQLVQPKINGRPSYGLDFGTSNSSISLQQDSVHPTVLPINFASSTPEVFQSALYFHQNKIYYATQAINQYLNDLASSKLAKVQNTVGTREIKVFQGSDLIKVNEYFEYEVSQTGRILRSFKSLLGSTQDIQTQIEDKTYTFADLVSIFLAEVKRRADSLSGQNIDQILIGRPVKFVGDTTHGKLPLARLEQAAKQAGFKEVKFEYEPIGAAYGYGVDHSGLVFVFDFGGGTLDTTIVNLDTNQVLASHGTPLGGDLIDQALYDFKIAHHFGKNLTYGDKQIPYPPSAINAAINWADISKYRSESFFDFLHRAKYRASSVPTIEFIEYFLRQNLAFALRKQIVETKEKLSSSSLAQLIFQTEHTTIDEQITQVEFKQAISDALELSRQTILETLTLAGVKAEQIDQVVLTGGSSLIPAFQDLVKTIFQPNKVQLYEPFTAVSKGLAILAKRYFN